MKIKKVNKDDEAVFEYYWIKGGYRTVKGFLVKCFFLFVYFVLFVSLDKLTINFMGKLLLKLALIMVLTGQQLTKST